MKSLAYLPKQKRHSKIFSFGALWAQISSPRSPYVKYGSLTGFALHPKWRPKVKALVVVRRVAGTSMQPKFQPNALVWASRLFRNLRAGDVVILEHRGLEKIKRVEAVQDGELFVLGDNAAASTDSRTIGWLPLETVKAKVIWPRP